MASEAANEEDDALCGEKLLRQVASELSELPLDLLPAVRGVRGRTAAPSPTGHFEPAHVVWREVRTEDARPAQVRVGGKLELFDRRYCVFVPPMPGTRAGLVVAVALDLASKVRKRGIRRVEQDDPSGRIVGYGPHIRALVRQRIRFEVHGLLGADGHDLAPGRRIATRLSGLGALDHEVEASQQPIPMAGRIAHGGGDTLPSAPARALEGLFSLDPASDQRQSRLVGHLTRTLRSCAVPPPYRTNGSTEISL